MPHHKPDPALALHRRHFAGADNLDLVADVGGPESGIPVILLHGGGQTRHSWKMLAQELVRNGFRVTNADLRGHGDSGWASNGNYGIDSFIGDLRCLVAAQPAPPVVVGASLGGITALLTLGESPALTTRGVALIDIVPKFEPEGSMAILRFMQAHPEGFASLEEAAAMVTAYLPHRPRPPSNAGLMKNLRPGKDGRLYWHWDPQMLGELGKHPGSQSLTERMERAARAIRVPALLVRGSKSDLVTMEGARHFLDLIPHASFVDVQGAAHMVAGDMNDVFCQSIIDFIGEKLRDRAG